MRGVRPYGSSWRAQIVDNTGELRNELFDNKIDAVKFCEDIAAEKDFAKGRVNKRKTATDTSLPVGILPWKYTRKGVTSYGYRTTMKINGKMVAVARLYGETRTKDEAIDILLIARAELFERKEREEHDESESESESANAIENTSDEEPVENVSTEQLPIST